MDQLLGGWWLGEAVRGTFSLKLEIPVHWIAQHAC